MVEQPYQSRLSEGMIRAYMSHDEVVGFAHQYPRGLLPPADAARVPTSKTFELPTEPAYAALKLLEDEVFPQCGNPSPRNARAPRYLGRRLLPRPQDGDDRRRLVLCEINVSSTFAFPEFAMPTVAKAAIERIQERT